MRVINNTSGIMFQIIFIEPVITLAHWFMAVAALYVDKGME
jgi:hypothetical protein